MNPLRLKLRGFIGIRDGLGRDEIEIDLSEYNDATLIALVGVNGAGKTTILDNLHPYRLQPSRASGYSPASFSYFDHTFADALKELEWEYGGVHYRSSIVIKGAGKTKKQECYLHKRDGVGEWLPVVLPDQTVSDGKTSTYDRCIETILGSPELFFTAAFACQGRKSLADYANADIKALMSDLLGLDHILALGEKANDVVKGLRARLDAIRGRADRAAEVAAERADAEQQFQQAERHAATTGAHKEDARAQAADATRRLAEAQSTHAQAAETQRRRETLTAQRDAVVGRRDAALADIAKEFQARRIEKEAARSAAATDGQRATAAAAAARTRIQKHEQLIARKDEVENAANRIAALDVEITGAERAVAEAEKAVAERTEAANAVRQLKTEGGALRAAHDGLQERCKLIGEVPCQGTDLQGRCKLLGEANAAAASLPEKTAALGAKRKEYESANERFLATSDLAPALAQGKALIVKLRGEHRTASEIAGLRHGIETAAQALDADRAALTAAEDLIARSGKASAEIERAIAQLSIDLEARNQETRASYKVELDAIDKELHALPPTDAQELAAAEKEAADAEAEVARLDGALAAAVAAVATLKERIAGLVKEAEALAGDVARAKQLEDEIAQWTLLAKALGRDGIVALCIDDAGPTLTAIANDLLTTCYGPRFSVQIATQRETAKGTLAEQFDIKVFDAEQDTVKSIRDVSGGERIWLNECMTRAIALYQAQASGRHYECLFSDESDGALDPEKKRQFMAMKRKVIQLGGYRREFFISHTPDLQAAADAVIDLTELKATTTTNTARKAA